MFISFLPEMPCLFNHFFVVVRHRLNRCQNFNWFNCSIFCEFFIVSKWIELKCRNEICNHERYPISDVACRAALMEWQKAINKLSRTKNVRNFGEKIENKLCFFFGIVSSVLVHSKNCVWFYFSAIGAFFFLLHSALSLLIPSFLLPLISSFFFCKRYWLVSGVFGEYERAAILES